MSELEQTPFTFHEFSDNPEPRCACLLLLDTSGSMGGAPIRELNSALIAFKQALSEDSLTVKRVEIAVVTFGPVHTESVFRTVDAWEPPHLTASGDTPIGEAITEGLRMLEQRKADYRANAIETFRPWVFLITDGGPTDRWEHTSDLIRQGELTKGFSFFGVGVENANMEILRKICTPERPPVKLAGLQFREMFKWLSASLRSVSASKPGPNSPVAIQAPKGWIEV